MSRCVLLVGAALALLGLALPVAGEAPDDGLPPALASDARSLHGLLLAVANETGSTEWSRVNASHATLAPAFESLHPSAAARLQSYLDLLGPAMREGNETDARSLAQAAARTVERDLLPVAEAWEKHRTGAVAGTPRATREGLEVPVVLVNAPPGGFAAFEVALRYDPANLTAKSARLASGQGDAHVDPANGTVRFASFDARGLAGLGSAGAVELGRVVFEAQGAGPHPVQVQVIDLVDRQGERLLALGGTGTLDPAAAVQGGPAGGVGRTVAVGAVLALAGGAIVAARKLLKV